MLYGEVQRQRLKIVRDFVVADTIDYLEMQFSFTEDWDGLSKWAHFSAMGKVYDIPLTDNTIRKEDHLNLSAGIWAVYLHGNEFADGVVVERITTNAVMMRVEPTGVLDGEPFAEVPASEVERILARLDALEKGGGGGGITEEKDPTVPDWAKQKEKPNYTAEEVGALPAGTRIPAKVSELQNDSGFITRTVADLVNYYRKTEVYARDETYSRAETDSVIAGLEKRLNGIADSDDVTLDQLSEIVAYIKNNKTLIESVTTSKVSVDDIVNNLKTPDAKKPLSAAQGVVLNDADISDVVFGKWDYSSDGTSYYMRVVLKSGGEILRTLPTHNPEDWITSADRAPYPSNGQFDTDWRRYGSWWVDETRGVLYLSQNGNVPGAGIMEPGRQKWLEIRGGLPEHTAADEGKFLRIVDDAAAWTETVTSAESVVNRTRAVQPMVTFVDDDGNADVWTKLKPLSEQYGIPFVSAMVTNRIGQDGSLTAEQLVALQDMGWEISSHTMGHVKLSDLTDAEQEAQMRGSKEALEAIGIRCDSICYPFSGTNDSTWKIARKYYRCGRQTNWKEWLNESPLETWDLRTTSIGSYYETMTESGLDTSTLEYYKWMVDRAVSGNAWLIFITHCNETDETQMGYLAQVIEYVQSLGVPIVTLREGLDRRGNIVDNGRYDRRNLEDEHFVVGCDSTVEKSAPDKYAVNLPANFAVNGTPPSAFPWNTVSTCRVTGGAAGFPFQSVYGGGTLVTNTMGAANMKDLGYRDYTEGRIWQEFYIPGSPAAFRRYAIDADTWSEWSYGSDVVLAQDSRAIDDAVSKFPVGTKSKVWITKDGTTAKRPDGINGWLLTDRTDVNGRLFWQTWIPMTKNDPKGNVYFRRWTGTAWDEWTCLGERTGSTNMLNWSITPKYVGACVFDTTRGKPVWWNGTAWVDATGAAV